jgi:hypothetical protein
MARRLLKEENIFLDLPNPQTGGIVDILLIKQ